MTSVLDCKVNLAKIRGFLKEAKSQGAEAAFLPECFYSMSDGLNKTPYYVTKDNEHFKHIQNLALEFGIALLGGSAITMENGHTFNRAYNFSASGEYHSHYDKCHLFACNIGKTQLNEAQMYDAGESGEVLDYGEFKIGFGICFDIRFSEFALNYFKQGVNLLTFPAAFTIPTGKAHWHVLNRARAIESQSFVISAAQWGVHNDRIKTYGHSLVISPWGEILYDAGSGENVHVMEISIGNVASVRQKIYMQR